MNQVAVVTDSTSALPQSILDEFDIRVIPLSVIWGEEQPLRIIAFHSNVPETAQSLLDDIKKTLSPEEIYLAELSPVIGTHVGLGTLAMQTGYVM